MLPKATALVMVPPVPVLLKLLTPPPTVSALALIAKAVVTLLALTIFRLVLIESPLKLPPKLTLPVVPAVISSEFVALLTPVTVLSN